VARPFFWALFVAIIAGCSSGKHPTSSSTAKKLRIAVIPKGTTHIFWKSVHAGAERAAKELGDVDIIWKAQLHESDREGQINVVQDFIVQQVDGIVLAPLDRTALMSVVLEAKQAGIPTVIFDSALEDTQNTVSYVATDNYHGGVLGARQLADAMGGKGNAILLRYTPGSESTEERERAFIDTIKKEFPQITLISDNQYAGTTPESALDKSLELLNQFGDKVNGIFAVCEPVAVGVLGALEQQGLTGKVKFIGFDPSPKMIEALKNDQMQGIVLQDPVNMGYEGVKAIVAHLRGQPVEKRIPTGEAIATRANVNTPEIVKQLNPEQAD
jgi:ribose transport system substrate-binding protein